MIEYKIGKVEGRKNEEQMFVVVSADNDLVFFSKSGVEYHKYVVEDFNLRNAYIVGGGLVGRLSSDKREEISLWGDSNKYGGIPGEVMVHFEPLLLKTYQRMYPKLKKLNIRTHCLKGCDFGVLDAKEWFKRKGLKP